jgi:hypothetical protein
MSIAAKYGQLILCAVATARQNTSTRYEVGMVKADEIPYDSNVGGDGLYWVNSSQRASYSALCDP